MITKSLDYISSSDSLHEKCGVCGVFGENFESSRIVYFGLWALQHRGQESSGISSTDGNVIRTHKNEGLVAHVYQEEDLKKLKGFASIGHNRYGTSGGSDPRHAQPVTSRHNLLTLAHNGNLPSVAALQEFLLSKKVQIDGLNDSELMHKALEYYMLKGRSIEYAIRKCFPLFTGVFSLLILTKNKMIALRDKKGIRPLSLGKLQGGYIVASETCAMDTLQAKYVRDIRPGEMLVVDKKGLHSYQLAKGEQKLDIFEFVYFARPDSYLLGKNVNEVRRNLGIQLAKEYPIRADMVIPVPDSAIPAAAGYSQASGIPFHQGFIKNRYIHRTFIRPDQHLRERDIQIKLNPLLSLMKGKDVIVIDDSLVRGSTARKIIAMMKRIGVRKVYLLLSCPPIRFPDFYGIDTPTQKELLAAENDVSQMQKYIGADRLCFLSYEGMVHATGLPESMFATYTFTGKYPIDLLEQAKTINFSVPSAEKNIVPIPKVDIIGFGALNIDSIHTIAHTYGGKKEVLLGQPVIQPGGAAASAITALARLGVSSGVVGKIGADAFGPLLSENFRKYGVDDTHVAIDPSVPSGHSFVFVNKEGKRTIYTKPGANSTLEKKEVPLKYLKTAKRIHFSNFLDDGQLSLQEYVLSQLGEDIAFSFWADSHILNSSKTIIEGMLKKIQTIFIRDSVLSEFTGYSGIEGARKLMTLGKSMNKTIAIIYSPWESEVVTHEGSYHVLTKKTPIIDETGISCGFSAGFLFGQLHGYSPSQSAHAGHVVASFIAEGYGAQANLPTLSDFLKRSSLLKEEKNILVVGGGGREHALSWKLSQSSRVKRIYVAPGNPGMVDVAHPVAIDVDDTESIKRFVKEKNIDIIIIGPELPLSKGIVNELEKEGHVVFGPTKEAAMLETSKSFAKEFMKKFNIPTAGYEVFTSFAKAKHAVEKGTFPLVVKVDGLAAGKGVLVAENKKEAIAFLENVFKAKKFGDAGQKVIIEEYMTGEEASVLAFSDGEHVIPLLPAQDHKRIFDKDKGPNTGGMGAYAPAPIITPDLLEEVVQKILLPTVRGMKKIGRPYKGILYAGIMVTKKGPKVVEFNCRFGDPETQAILPLLQTDLLHVIENTIQGTLKNVTLTWKEGAGICIILSAPGYPEKAEVGKELKDLSRVNHGTYVFHSGTKAKLITASGRVLGIYGTGKTLQDAITVSYKAIEEMDIDDMHYRHDIGVKGLKHK